MISNQQLYGILSAVLAVAAFLPYIRSIHKGTTKPERSSWWIWSLLMAAALAAQIGQGAKWSLSLTVCLLIGNFYIAMLSLKKGYGRFGASDAFALIASVAGIILWLKTDSPLLALVIVMVVDGLGSLMTVNKSWKAPYSENLFTWLVMSLASVMSVLAVGDLWSQKAAFPVYEVLINLLTYVVIYDRRIQIKPRRRNKRLSAR